MPSKKSKGKSESKNTATGKRKKPASPTDEESRPPARKRTKSKSKTATSSPIGTSSSSTSSTSSITSTSTQLTTVDMAAGSGGRPAPPVLYAETWRQYVMLRAYTALWPDFGTLMFLTLQKKDLPASERQSIEQLKAAGLAMDNFWIEWSRRLRIKYAGEAQLLELVELAMCSISMDVQLAVETASTKREYRLRFKLSAYAFYHRQRWRIPDRWHKWMGAPGPQTWSAFLPAFAENAAELEARTFTVKHASLQPLIHIVSLFKSEECLAWHIQCWTTKHREDFNDALRTGRSHSFHHDAVPRLGSQFPLTKIHRRLLDLDRSLGRGAWSPGACSPQAPTQ